MTRISQITRAYREEFGRTLLWADFSAIPAFVVVWVLMAVVL